MAKSNAAIT